MKKILSFLLLIALFSCKEEKHPYTFYYWKTKLSLNQTESNTLQEATIPYIYVRYFDVDKISGKFQPIAAISKDQSFKTYKQIVPVVFITNRTFINITPQEITFLAKNTLDLIKKKNNDYNLKTNNEIQIDCDWTLGTKDDYFKLLNELRNISGKEITSTLRLHQVKHKKKMGIPPVEKVYLMCYSTSSPLENSDKNSILDLELLKNYLSNIERYPIKNIAVALPIYSWGIVTNHSGKHKIINALSKDDLKHPNFKKTSENEIEIQKDGFYFGNYLNKGFKIKVEEIENKQLDEAVEFLNGKIKEYEIIYYQLDSKFVKNRKL